MYIDMSKVQTLTEFSQYRNSGINYPSDQFFIALSGKADDQFRKMGGIDLCDVYQFGWYSEREHKTLVQIYAHDSTVKMQNLIELNPGIRIESFDRLRDRNLTTKKRNILAGAFGLSYFVYKKEYDEFFSKFLVKGDTWYLPQERVDKKTELPFLIQLAVLAQSSSDSIIYENAETPSIVDEIPKLSAVYELYAIVLYYFVSNNYSSKSFLEYLIEKFSLSAVYKSVIPELSDYFEKAVLKGLPFTPGDRVVTIIDEFISLARTEISDMQSFLLTNRDRLSKSAVFFLGMLNQHDYLEEPMGFTNFPGTFVALCGEALLEMKVNGGDYLLVFDTERYGYNRNNKYGYISEYLNEIRYIQRFLPEYNRIHNLAAPLIDWFENEELLEDLKKLNAQTAREIQNLQYEKHRLIREAEQLEAENKKLKDSQSMKPYPSKAQTGKKSNKNTEQKSNDH